MSAPTASFDRPEAVAAEIASMTSPRLVVFDCDGVLAPIVDHADDAFALRAGTLGAEILDRTEDLVEYARTLYSSLRSADERGVRVLIAVLPPPGGLGDAIRDRLTKAAAPRAR